MQKDTHDGQVLKKVGEVLAFTTVGLETLERGEAAFVQVFSEDEYEQSLKALEEILADLEYFLEKVEDVNIVHEKAEKTSAKLINMRDLYINDQWDDQVELLEWLGFFQGAAFVHWGLVYGYTSGGYVAKLHDTAKSAMEFHENFLHRVVQIANDMGSAY